MKNRFILIFTLLCSLNTMAALSLVVKPLVGNEHINALSNLGKIVYSGDSLYIYDTTQTIVYSNAFSNIQHVRFRDTIPSTPTVLEHSQTDDKILVSVYPNPTAHILYIKNAEDAELRFYSINGHLLQIIEGTDDMCLDLSTYPAGVYLLNCRTRNQNFQIIKK